MSCDTVDDLQYAEDKIGALRQALIEILAGADPRTFAHLTSPYCRADCGFIEYGECESEDPDTCGCPCGHEPEEATDG